MYCPYCGNKVEANQKFCNLCGKGIALITSDGASANSWNTVEDITSESIMLAGDEEEIPEKYSSRIIKNSWLWKFILVIVVVMLLGVLCVAGINWCKPYIEQKKKEEQERIARNHQIDVMRALREYSYNPYGVNDEDSETVQYSMVLYHVSDAALADSVSQDSSGNEVKEHAFNSMEAYAEDDYAKFYASLIFGADYFTEAEINQFYNGTKLSSTELKENAEELMCGDALSLSTLLVNENDEIICLNIGAQINFVQQGYMSEEELVDELYDFVYNNSGISTINEELLLENESWEDIEDNSEAFFSGSKVYYKDLSPVGQMVFLYVMPNYISSFDQNAADELWNYYYDLYENSWNEIINRDIFSNILN